MRLNPGKAKKMMYALIAAIAVGWPLMELVQAASDRHDPYEAVRLLHQVSVFQMDGLYSRLQQAESAETAGELEGLLHSAYAAQYTHERLMLAAGAGEKPLASVDALIQYILRLQMGIGGHLTAEDSEMFREAADLFEELHNPYRRLIGSDGKLNSSNETAVWRADEALHRVFRQKLLE